MFRLCEKLYSFNSSYFHWYFPDKLPDHNTKIVLLPAGIYLFKVRSQYLVRLISYCWITGGHTIHPPIEGLQPLTGIESTPFRNSVYKVAGLKAQMNR